MVWIMPRALARQLNIRSEFARERAAFIAAETGLTVTEVVEEALRAFQPASGRKPPGDLISKGGILVKPGRGRRITQEQANALMEEDRAERGL